MSIATPDAGAAPAAPVSVPRQKSYDQAVRRLNKGYAAVQQRITAARETGVDTWTPPTVEQARRDRRAKGKAARAARRVTRRSK